MCSNWDWDLGPAVAEAGLAGAFDVLVSSAWAGARKPHPRIFEYALEHLGIEPKEAVMVGDSLRADVEGAKTLGIKAVWRRPPVGEPVEATTDIPEPGPLAPDYTIDNIGDLKALPIFEEPLPAK